MYIHYFQHVPFEDLGIIKDWSKKNSHTVGVTRFFRRDAIPDVHSFDWLIVMGGPMSVHDEDKYKWLLIEKKAIEKAIANNKKVLGICLGAQLIADVLGAQVFKNAHKEIGWFPIQLTTQGQRSPFFQSIPDEFDVFHWHGETFNLPDGAVRLAKSSACKNQAFMFGSSVVGLQFHMEMTPESIDRLIENCAYDLTEGKYIQNPRYMTSKKRDFPFGHYIMHKLLDEMQNIKSL